MLKVSDLQIQFLVAFLECIYLYKGMCDTHVAIFLPVKDIFQFDQFSLLFLWTLSYICCQSYQQLLKACP